MQAKPLSVVIATLFISGIVLAQSSAPPAKTATAQIDFAERFMNADRNGDKALTMQEAQNARMAGIAARFEAIDADKDGKVKLEEFRAYLKRRVRTGPMA